MIMAEPASDSVVWHREQQMSLWLTHSEDWCECMVNVGCGKWCEAGGSKADQVLR